MAMDESFPCTGPYSQFPTSHPSLSRLAEPQIDLHDHLGVCFQAIGNMVNFEYSCTEECVEVLADEYRGCLLIVEGDYVVVEDLVKRVQVYRGREDWNCQNWVLGAVEKLKRRGYVGENITANAIRHELDEMWKNWDNKMN